MEQHRVLVVGTGSIGERHVRCFDQTGRASISVCEVNEELRDRVVKKYGATDAFSDLASAIASQPDVAVVCTPANLHVQMATQLADAGVHVLCEKPLSVELDGVENLVQTVDRTGITFAVAYVRRCHDVGIAYREAINTGRFGRPVNLVCTGGQMFPFHRPAYRDIYYNDHRTGGGAIQDSITHLMNFAEWLLGPIDRLTADAAHCLLEGVEVEDTIHVLTRQGDVLGSFAHNQYQAPNEAAFSIVCTKATVRVEFHHNCWMWQDDPAGRWHVEKFAPAERDVAYINQANLFLDAVEGKRDVHCTLEEGIRSLHVNRAMLASAETGQWQKIAP